MSNAITTLDLEDCQTVEPLPPPEPGLVVIIVAALLLSLVAASFVLSSSCPPPHTQLIPVPDPAFREGAF